jgi:hypothetical protein
MKINRILFWTFSLCIALLNCYLFQLSSVEQYTDPDYMQSLQLPSDSDTPTVAIAGVVLLSYVSAVANIILLTAILPLACIKERQIKVVPGDFVPDFQKGRPFKTSVQLLAYLITAFWLWSFIKTTGIKFFGTMLLFTILAILVTWTYALWAVNLTTKTT